MLEILKETENRYFGIPTIRKEMEAAFLHGPVFSVMDGEFKVTLYNGFISNEKESLRIVGPPVPIEKINSRAGKTLREFFIFAYVRDGLIIKRPIVTMNAI